MTGSKNDDLEFGGHFPEKGEGVRTDVDADFDGRLVDFDLKFHVDLTLNIFDTMDQRFVKVQNQGFFVFVLVCFFQL